MFIIYGNRSARIKRENYNGAACSNCKSFGAEVSTYRKYFHVFYAPMLAWGRKTAVAQCVCGHHWTDEVTAEQARQAKTPVYLYSLLFVFAIGIAALGYSISKDKENTKLYVAAPQEGDVYLIKSESMGSHYYFLRLEKAAGDSVTFLHNELRYNRYVSKFAKDDYFDGNDAWTMSKQDLLQMYNDGEVKEVMRYYDDYEGFGRIH
ncbi:zinc ribbon domain-containing protein [Chitinophaga horti]|uniref:Zinc ribbon domain-containing protein n=1 Tax=Chitinophaga horti TaxID=2920382 RepID=A0ABY6JAV2_9BACT|nr:zinc ribbon domain-containing protein [Chitinophaga horti]UYQ95426.1 zinc ribbon domain-containing protein [Chitinophaga horti]